MTNYSPKLYAWHCVTLALQCVTSSVTQILISESQITENFYFLRNSRTQKKFYHRFSSESFEARSETAPNIFVSFSALGFSGKRVVPEKEKERRDETLSWPFKAAADSHSRWSWAKAAGHTHLKTWPHARNLHHTSLSLLSLSICPSLAHSLLPLMFISL